MAIADQGPATVHARLDLPPPESARIRFPESFGTRFAIFGDAEEEFDWNAPFSRDATATTAIAALPEANRFFTGRGCVPTYLADWPVVSNPDSAATMRAMVESGACEIGTQLHPWVTPPFDEDVTPANSYVGNLPRDLQRAKLRALTDKIEAATGVRPTVYRAGRYGVGEHSAALLAEAGYRLDVSVRSRFDYRHQHGPDFSHHPIWPWHIGRDLFEVPLTTAYTGLLRDSRSVRASKHGRSLLARSGLFDRVPLTPEGVPLKAALAAIERLLDDGQQLFSLSFHTPSIVPGHTPYVRDAADLKKFWAWWDGVFAAFGRADVKPAATRDIIAQLAVI